MKRTPLLIIGFAVAFTLGFIVNKMMTKQSEKKEEKQAEIKQEPKTMSNMKLGAFSISLSVKDLKISKEFYENLGFVALAGEMEQNYLIMKNENSIIGLFQGMFTGNMLTFNPGWDENGKDIEKFEDIRVIQKHLKSKGIKLTTEADEKTTGPASLMLTDPDGNVILMDQHR